jgi:hypothetical protein
MRLLAAVREGRIDDGFLGIGMAGQDQAELLEGRPAGAGVVARFNRREGALDCEVVFEDLGEPITRRSRRPGLGPRFGALLIAFRRRDGRNDLVDE